MKCYLFASLKIPGLFFVFLDIWKKSLMPLHWIVSLQLSEDPDFQVWSHVSRFCWVWGQSDLEASSGTSLSRTWTRAAGGRGRRGCRDTSRLRSSAWRSSCSRGWRETRWWRSIQFAPHKLLSWQNQFPIVSQPPPWLSCGQQSLHTEDRGRQHRGTSCQKWFQILYFLTSSIFLPHWTLIQANNLQNLKNNSIRCCVNYLSIQFTAYIC